MNKTRTGMKGVNSLPLPPGDVTVHQGGQMTVQTPAGTSYGVRGNGTISSYAGPGHAATFGPDGGIRSVHTDAVDISRGPRGDRTTVSQPSSDSTLVGTGPGRGYLERPVSSDGQNFTERTYVDGDKTYNRFYGGYQFNDVPLSNYLASTCYSPDFYGYAYHPWAAPVSYAQPWTGDPWYAASRGYFTPAPAYGSGAQWLTDYILAQTLAGAYADQQGVPMAAPPGQLVADPASGEMVAVADTPISPEARALLVDVVGRQLAAENAVASGSSRWAVTQLPNALKPGRAFLAATTVNVVTAERVECTLGAGDLLQLITLPPEDPSVGALRVLSSRAGECAAGAVVMVLLQDLQEMHNSLRAQMDAGLQVMRATQGQGGLPPAPAAESAQACPDAAPTGAAGGDPNVAGMLDDQQQAAGKTESSVLKKVFSFLTGQQ